jgi:hypothetical protein
LQHPNDEGNFEDKEKKKVGTDVGDAAVGPVQVSPFYGQNPRKTRGNEDLNV